MQTLRNHPFLGEPGSWRAKGSYYNEVGKVLDAEGETTVRHAAGRWTAEGILRWAAEQPIELRIAYAIEPPQASAGATEWQAESSAVGRLSGQFLAVGKSILSLGASEDNAHELFECLVNTSRSQYDVWGLLMRERIRIGAWQMTLVREHAL
jgi:hypothetical protein